MINDFGKCTRCGEYGFLNAHRCSPVWLVSDENSDEEWNEWKLLHARDAEQAAERFCERSDANQGDYPSHRTVYVKQDEDSPAIAYDVSCELVPSYRAALNV